MRFKHKNLKKGDIRVIRKFLFTPKRIGNETRWLEWASIEQKLFFGFPYTFTIEWQNIRFVD